MRKENRRLIADIAGLKDALADESRRFSIAKIEAQEAHQKVDECETAWEIENQERRAATQEVGRAQVTLGALQSELSSAVRENERLRELVQTHLRVAEDQANWIRNHQGEMDEIKKVNDDLRSKDAIRDAEYRAAMHQVTQQFEASKRNAEQSQIAYATSTRAAQQKIRSNVRLTTLRNFRA